MKKDEPRISVCNVDVRTGWGLGCGGTVPGIRAWRKRPPCRQPPARELSRRIGQITGATTEADDPRTDKRGG
jgi:uncharacterized protein